MSEPVAPAQPASSFDSAMASRLRHLEAQLEQYDADAGAETLAGMDIVDETGAVPAQVALRRHRNSVDFLRQHAPASRSAAIMYEAALHRDIGLRELALGREDSAVRHYAAGLRLHAEVFEWSVARCDGFRGLLDGYCARNGEDANFLTLSGHLFLCQANKQKALDLFRGLGEAGCIMRVDLLMETKQYHEAIADCTLALRLGDATQDPNTNYMHYARAFARTQIRGDKVECRSDFETFVRLCAGDERFLCDACYLLAFFDMHRSADDARAWFKKGSKAERTRSPVFAHQPLPETKHLVATLYGKAQLKCAMRGCQGEGRHQCARCLAVRYCSAECQRADWKAAHKAACVKRDG